VSVWCRAGQDSIDSGIAISKAERKIDASTHLVKVSAALTVENGGRSAIKSFLYAVDPSLKDYISFIGATVRITFFALQIFILRQASSALLSWPIID